MSDRVDHRADDLAAQPDLRLEEVGEADEDRVEVAGGLAGADHGDVDALEDLAVLAERVAERRAFVDLRPDVGEIGFSFGLLDLVDERAQRLGERHAGLEQRRRAGG